MNGPRKPLPTNDLLEYARMANAGASARRSARPAPPSVRPPPVSAPTHEDAPVLLQLPPTPPSVAPPAPSVVVHPAPRSRREVTWPVVVASLLGLAIVLYRNDVLLTVARAAQMEGKYLGVEGSLGGPGFGTPRSLASVVLPPAAPGEAAQVAVPPPPPAAATQVAEAAPAPAAAPEPSDEATPSPRSAPRPRSAARAPSRARPAAAKRSGPAPAVVLDDEAPSSSKPKGESGAKPAKAAPDGEPLTRSRLDDAIRAAVEKN